MALRWRVAGLLAVLALILVAAGVVVTSALQDVQQQRRDVIGRLQPAAENTRRILTSLVNEETGERGFLISGDEAYLKPYKAGRVNFPQRVLAVRRAFPHDTEINAQLDKVQGAAHHWHKVGAKPEIAARRAGNYKKAVDPAVLHRSKVAFDTVRHRVAVLQGMIDDRLDAQRVVAGKSYELLRTVIIGSALLLVALVLLTGLLLRRWVLVPVSTLRANMRDVAQGHLDRPVDTIGPPEVAAIGRDAESMRRRIVLELDTARAATEALDQHSPVVSGLRADLAAGPVDALEGVAVYGVLHAAEGVLAGDWWETVRRRNDSTAMLIADVSGHGAEAGLVALRFKHRITALLRTDMDLLEAFTTAAEELDADVEKFLSCILVEVVPRTGLVRWINAGHPSALVLRGQGEKLMAEELKPTGPLIGALEGGWSVAETKLKPGELLLAMTDGIVEARRGRDEEFEIEGVLNTLKGLRRLTPKVAVTECVEAVRRYADDWTRDDVTVVALELMPWGYD